MQHEFDELMLYARMKERPGMYFGEKSLLSLRDTLSGMNMAFGMCGRPDAMKYFRGFTDWYTHRLFETDRNGYSCWWNHILYTSGNSNALAFDRFFRQFEDYLQKEHGLSLPKAQWDG